jgi:DNA-binding NarL/FixJ family response regulator
MVFFAGERGITVQTVLVCVRTSQAAANIGSCAERLGVGSAVRTATTAEDAITALQSFPAAIVFADTALTRPDTVGFTRKVMSAVPHAQLVLFGLEEPATAQAAIRAGARGLIGGADADMASAAAKALLLVNRPLARAEPSRVAAGGLSAGRAAPGPSGGPVGAQPAGPTVLGGYGRAVPQSPTVVPAQRGDVPADVRAPDGALVRTNGLGIPTRRGTVALTERELQVLRGMADGHSNAEIGRELFVSEDTVKTHARRLFRKLGARDRAHAVAAGFRAGLVR